MRNQHIPYYQMVAIYTILSVQFELLLDLLPLLRSIAFSAIFLVEVLHRLVSSASRSRNKVIHALKD